MARTAGHSRNIRSGTQSASAVFGVHSTRFPHQRSQLIQFIELAKYVDKSPGERIVMGDFNATPYSRLLQTFQRNSGLNRLTNLPTWSAGLAIAADRH